MQAYLLLTAALAMWILAAPRASATPSAHHEYVYAAAETVQAGDLTHTNTLTELRLHGWRVRGDGHLTPLPPSPSLFDSPLLAPYRGKMYARPALQMASSGSNVAVFVNAEREFGNYLTAYFLYTVQRDGRLKLKRAASAPSILPLALQRQLNYFADNGGRYFYKRTYSPSASETSYSQALSTYRVERDNSLTYQGRCFLPGYFKTNLLTFAPDGRTAYLPELQGYIYQLRVLPNGVLRNLHPGFVHLNAAYDHSAAAFSAHGRTVYFAVNDYLTNRNAHIALLKKDKQGQLSWPSPHYIYSDGEAWSIVPDGHDHIYTVNGLGGAVVQFAVRPDDTLQHMHSYRVPGVFALAALVLVQR